MYGGSSLLIIFAVLCFTTFTLLSLSTALAHTRLSDASANAVTDYYAADQKAEAVLAQLRQGKIPEGVRVEDHIYSYSCPISDTQELVVEILCASSPTAGDNWKILRWQAVSTIDYSQDNDLE